MLDPSGYCAGPSWNRLYIRNGARSDRRLSKFDGASGATQFCTYLSLICYSLCFELACRAHNPWKGAKRRTLPIAKNTKLINLVENFWRPLVSAGSIGEAIAPDTSVIRRSFGLLAGDRRAKLQYPRSAKSTHAIQRVMAEGIVLWRPIDRWLPVTSQSTQR